MASKKTFISTSILCSALCLFARPDSEHSFEAAGGSEETSNHNYASVDSIQNDSIQNDSTENDIDYTYLDEFVITEHAKLVKSDGATLTYNVTEDPESASSNTLQILRKIPGVTVDAEDNVKVNGQSSFKILLNGREDPMLKGDIKTVLKSLPASTIKKIEVISEPGAKYDAEGVGGILNIVTDKSQTLTGYMTQIGTWINSYQVGGYVNARGKFNKVMLDANVSYNNGRPWKRTYNSDRTVENLDDSENYLLSSSSKSSSGWDYTGANLNMSWEPDTLNLFTVALNFGNNGWDSHGIERRFQQRCDMSTVWDLTRDADNKGSYLGLGGQLSYQHNFLRDDHNIVISYEYDFSKNNGNNDYTATYLSGEGTETPFSTQLSKNHSNSHILQFDYSNKLSKRHLIEAGGKLYLTDNSSFSLPSFGESAANAVPSLELAMDMSQIKNLYALFGSYSGTFSKWNVKAGLRYEYTYMGVRYRLGEYPDFTTRLHDLVPNAAISYNLASATSLRFAYQMRISRPSIYNINPYVNVLTPGQISYGNPDLKSEKGHLFSLGYSNYEGKFSGSAKLTYRYVNNGVNDVIFVRDGILNSTYANIGESHNAGIDLSGDWNITSDLRWSVYGSANYVHMRADSEMLHAHNQGWQGSFSTNLNYTLLSKWKFSGYGGLWTPWIDLQGKGTSTGYYYGIGASRDWLKDDALNIQISAGNFLTPRRTSNYEQINGNLILKNSFRYSQWNVGVSISFKFGGLTSSVKRTAASIEKEESQSSGGNKGAN